MLSLRKGPRVEAIFNCDQSKVKRLAKKKKGESVGEQLYPDKKAENIDDFLNVKIICIHLTSIYLCCWGQRQGTSSSVNCIAFLVITKPNKITKNSTK